MREPPYHTRTWLLWVSTATLAAGVTRNPFYLLVVLLAARLVDTTVAAARSTPGSPDPGRQGWGTFLRLGLVIAAFTSGFNVLAAHVGDHVLVRLPGAWPLIGGPLTLESLVYGLLNGLTLITLLAVFGAFSAGVDAYALLRGIPAGLAQAGLVTAIALAYVPQTLIRWQEIREAQVLRGHRLRGARDLVPLAVPLLTGGLERAITLAEAMEARGFTPERLPPASSSGPAIAHPGLRLSPAQVRLLLSAGVLALLVGGFLSLYFRQQAYWGWAIAGGGIAALGVALLGLNGRPARTRYRRERWRMRDGVVSAVLLGAIVVLVAVAGLTPAAWAYTPYPGLHWPPFDPLLGIVLLALAAPAVPFLAMRDHGSEVRSQELEATTDP